MDYFEAVQEGRKRADRALAFLREITGPCSPLLFLKIGPGEWTPIGEENLFAVVPGKNETAAVVLCDADGNSKAMSSWLSLPRIESFRLDLVARGIPKFEGELKLPS